MGEDTVSTNSWFANFVLFVSVPLGFFNVGFHFTALGPVIPALQFMYNSTYASRNGESLPDDKWLLFLTLTMSFQIVGGFLGGSSSKFLLSFLSAKRVQILCHVLNILGILLMSLVGGVTWSYEAIIIGRLVAGFPLGVYYAVLPSVVTELSAKKTIPAWQSYGGIALTFGCLFGPSFAHPKVFGNIHLWPILIAISGIPSIIYLLSCPWLPESPYYLARSFRTKEAMDTLRKLRRDGMSVCKSEMDEIEREISKSSTVVGVKELFTTRQYRNQALTVTAVYAGFMLTGVNNFVIYTDQVFLQANISPDVVTYCTIGVFALQVLGGIFGSRLVIRFGGRAVNIGSIVVIIFALTTFTISQATTHLAPNIMPYIAIVSVAIFMVSFFGGTNLSTLVLLGELTIEPTRATALACGSVVLWILSWFVGFIPPYLQIALGSYSMVIWLGCSILYLIFQLVYLPETKGKTQEEIQAHFM